jgi:hypothetical protein
VESYAIKLFIRNSPSIHKKGEKYEMKNIFSPQLLTGERRKNVSNLPRSEKTCPERVSAGSEEEILCSAFSPQRTTGARRALPAVTLFMKPAVN